MLRVARSIVPRPLGTDTTFKTSIAAAVAIAGCLLFALARTYDAPYYLIFSSRILIFALAATSLNFILGFGGMVSFGHALFLAVGAYSVAIPSLYGFNGVFYHLVAAITLSCSIAFVTGLVALRTRGTAFIMITLAFAQMIYFLLVSQKQYGGDEGLNIKIGSQFAGVSLGDPYALYPALLVVLGAALYANWRTINSPFGMILRGIMQNEERMEALGYPAFRCKLIAYTISGGVCGVAGVFLANLTLFASPAYGAWTVSGDLMLMVATGGIGTIGGPVVGAAALMIFEDVLKRTTVHWTGYLGALIILVGLAAKRGIWGLLEACRKSA